MSDLNSKPLYSLTVAEYVELNKKIFSEETAKLLNHQPEAAKQTAESDIIFVEDVLKLTGYRKATLYTKVSRFEIPVLSRRKPLTFSRVAIIQWLKDGKPDLIEQDSDKYLKQSKS